PERQRDFYEEQRAAEAADTGWWRGLPRQLVHHDILIFNLLAQEGRITGALDFDFASMDVGMLELAICLNHVLQQSEGNLEMADAFLQGYGRFRRHTVKEMGCLARATRLYHLAVLRLYIGEHYAGKPVEPQFRYILGQFETRMQGLAAYGEELERLCRARLSGYASA
ncbi:phosphotransferase, partial [Paenibacillus sp. 598K]|uniref:phosphotransferase n=1 Tax=Paenibacillus sp. 598K TaxID=1117987 RepID=UPI0021AA7712